MDPIEDADMQDFFEEIAIINSVTELDLSSRYINDSSEIENNVLSLSQFIISEISRRVSILDFIEEINIDQENKFFSSIRNFKEFEMAINTCEDYTPPNQTGGNTGNPIPTKPPVIEYYFSGINPITKKPASWKSLSKDSKRPPDATVDYIHVGLIDTSVKTI